MIITIQYGTGNLRQKEFPGGITIKSVLADPDFKELGYGDNVQAIIGGVTQPDDIVLLGDTVINIHNKFCEKSGTITIEGYRFSLKGHLDRPMEKQERKHVHVLLNDHKPLKFWLDTGDLAEPTRAKDQIVSHIKRVIQRNKEELERELWTKPNKRYNERIETTANA